MAAHILVLHGPNLNLLGTRETSIYGKLTLAEIDADLSRYAHDRGAKFATAQSNHEGELIERIHAARAEGVDFIVINAAALTHTSVGLRDALLGVAIPFIEVHLSNVYKRESFRHTSLLADAAVAVVSGLGPFGYRAALEFALDQPSEKVSQP